MSYVAPTIDYSGNCGNISSGVAPFAIDEGLVKVEEPYTTVRVHNTNTNSILIERVQVVNGKAKVLGDYKIDGVPGTGAEISIDFSQTAGAKTGKLLPTGNVKDKVQVTGVGELVVSIVDAANPMVFVKAKDLGRVELKHQKKSTTTKKCCASWKKSGQKPLKKLVWWMIGQKQQKNPLHFP